jgi:ParB family transcriptional regulator, chromosome partitioning protein
MNARATSKAALLGESASFAAAATRLHSERGRLIEGIGPRAEEGATPPRIAQLADLALNPENPRETLTEIQEMADSLLENGQLQVATVITRAAFVAKHPGREDDLGEARWVVLDGNRRLAGARQAGLDELRIDVRDDLADDLLTNAFVANIQHESFSPLEEARGLAKLVEEHGGLRAVARKISKSHVWVSQRLALLQLTPELQTAVDAGQLPVEDARKIGRLSQEEQAAAAAEAAAARQARKADPRTRAGRRAGGAAPDTGEPGGNAVSTPPADGRSPEPRAEVPGGPGDTTPAGDTSPSPAVGSGTTTEAGVAAGASPGGNGVSTAPADGAAPEAHTAVPGGPGDTTSAGDTSPPAGPASQASRGSGAGIRTRSGNAVSTPSADVSEVVDWSDLPALASAIRQHLSDDELGRLLGLLTG